MIAVILAAVWLAALIQARDHGTIGVTPHDSYSSSVGVLGCKLDTNRVAYWPSSVSCDDICVSVSYQGRKLHLLKIDQSGGAYDISYDAWNYLYTGKSATSDPTAGGAVDMQFEYVDADECKDLIHTDGSKLPLSAANSMNYLTSCLEADGSWVGDHYALYNIQDAICTMGYDEECDLNWPDANQATCKHQLGDNAELKDDPVYNIMYPSGEKELATSGATSGDSDDGSGSGKLSVSVPLMAALLAHLTMLG